MDRKRYPVSAKDTILANDGGVTASVGRRMGFDIHELLHQIVAVYVPLERNAPDDRIILRSLEVS